MSKESTNFKKNYITLLNVISMVSVVILHTNGCFWSFSKSRWWFTANIIESVFYFAVPILFMITGVTLLDYHKKYSTKEYFKKRLIKTFIPFIIWSIVGLLFRLFYIKDIFYTQLSFKFIWNGIFNTNFISIYWFFIPLFIVYLCIPILASIDNKYKNNVYKYIIITNFIFSIIFPFINQFFNLSLSLPISLTIGNTFIMYVLLGYLLDKKDIHSKKYLYFIYIMAIIGLLTHIVGTYSLSMKAGRIVDFFKGYNNFPCVFYSIGIFIFIKRISQKKNVDYKIINFISEYSFAVYLIHYYLIILISDFFNFPRTSIYYRLGLPFLIIPLCILIAFIIRKIPFIKKSIP